ncbi:MAG: hypothetical protein KNN13_02680 [Hydrogenobacter thermophilus]|nr:MAG: hypothetical protein KNN13_02680 [Hydrogenobacter thermophilus]
MSCMKYLMLFVMIFTLGCATVNKKLDPKAKLFYERGYEGQMDFNVLVKDEPCKERIRSSYRVKVEGRDFLVLTLTHSELKKLLQDDCITFVSAPQRLEHK